MLQAVFSGGFAFRAVMLVALAAIIPVLVGCSSGSARFERAAVVWKPNEQKAESVDFVTNINTVGLADQQVIVHVSLLDRRGRPILSHDPFYRDRAGRVAATKALMVGTSSWKFDDVRLTVPARELELTDEVKPVIVVFDLQRPDGSSITKQRVPLSASRAVVAAGDDRDRSRSTREDRPADRPVARPDSRDGRSTETARRGTSPSRAEPSRADSSRSQPAAGSARGTAARPEAGRGGGAPAARGGAPTDRSRQAQPGAKSGQPRGSGTDRAAGSPARRDGASPGARPDQPRDTARQPAGQPASRPAVLPPTGRGGSGPTSRPASRPIRPVEGGRPPASRPAGPP